MLNKHIFMNLHVKLPSSFIRSGQINRLCNRMGLNKEVKHDY